MINIATFEQPNEALMIRSLDPATVAGEAGIARYQPESDAVVRCSGFRVGAATT